MPRKLPTITQFSEAGQNDHVIPSSTNIFAKIIEKRRALTAEMRELADAVHLPL